MFQALARVLLVALAAGCAAPTRADAPLTLSLACTQTPKESGLKLDRTGIAPDSVTVNGQATEAWVSHQHSVAADEWARSFCVTVTDPRFLGGKIPSVDVDVTYYHPGNTKVEVVAATTAGSRVVGSGWGTPLGQTPQWQTLHCHFDDAAFGRRDLKDDPKSLPVDGFDLRVNAWAADFRVAKIAVTGSDPAHVTDWTHYLGVDAVADASKFIVAPGGSDAMTFRVHNSSQVAAAGTVRWEIVDAGGKLLRKWAEPVTLPVQAVTAVPFSFAAKDLPTGEYGVRLNLDVAGSTPLRYEQPLVVAGPRDAFVVFDKTPITRGLDFERAHLSPALLTVDGVRHWVWQGGDARGADPWWSSLVLYVTDPRFAQGRMPAVDATVVYRHVPDAPLTLFADTAAGSRQIAFAWGRQDAWQTVSTQIDDAKFARTDYHDPPKDLKSDGWDLRWNSCSGPVELRSIFLRGHDLDSSPDYTRLLRFDSLDAGRDLFIFRPGEHQTFQMRLRNIAHVALHADYDVTLKDDLDNPVWTRRASTVIQGGGPFAVPVDFNTSGLKQGVYTLALSLGRTGPDGRRETLLTPQVNLMVSEQSAIPKAKPGDFLYGLDTGVDYHDARWMQWMDFMGVDITRGNGANDNPDDWSAAFAAYDKHAIQNTVFWSVPWDPDPAALDRKIKDAAAGAEAAARKYGDRAHYWELGNEPDLTFFYPGPIESYEKGMVAIAQAIRRGNPSASVMNGGLANTGGPESHPRTATFLKILPADAVSLVAYHGHGPLVGAERGAHDRIHDMLVEDGKGQLPQVETESGLSAHTPGQIRIQARTAVEKIVYAQSVGEPTLLWFRLYIDGGDGDYTTTINLHEPRPAVLSYRTMAKTLKGLAFVRTVDLGTPDAEGYLFAEKDGARRALVIWADAHGGGTAAMRLSAGKARNVRQVDLFGNVKPLSGTAVVTAPVDLDPVYVTWDAPETTDVVKALPNPLLVPSTVMLSAGGEDAVSLRVRNTESTPLDATLTIHAGSESGVTPLNNDLPVHVAAGAEATVSVPVRVSASERTVAWPRRWTVFAPLPTGEVAVTEYATDIPAKITERGKAILPQTANLMNDQIDLAPLGGGFGEKKEALLFARIDSPAAQTITIGSSADWWEQWFVNGVPVFSDLETGNGGAQSVLQHQFTAHLRAGRNVLAVRVLSGSQGWKLTCGGPQEVAQARSADGGGSAALVLELHQGDTILARARPAVALRPQLEAPLGLAWQGPASAWDAQDPEGALTEEGIVNEWAMQPDSSRWWHGPDDLSGRIWLRADARMIYLTAAIADDDFVPGRGAAGIDAGDSLRVALADGAGGAAVQFGLPAGGGIYRRGPDGRSWAEAGADQAAAKVERVGRVTWYRMKVARSLAPSDRLAIDVLANDDDGFGHKQCDAWFSGMDAPASSSDQWWQCRLPAAQQPLASSGKLRSARNER